MRDKSDPRPWGFPRIDEYSAGGSVGSVDLSFVEYRQLQTRERGRLRNGLMFWQTDRVNGVYRCLENGWSILKTRGVMSGTVAGGRSRKGQALQDPIIIVITQLGKLLAMPALEWLTHCH